ncbi:serine/threonine-protein kinase TOUSLED-like [Arachis duranensis]|uniref:Serine/threonine-protein kinase TOUSLED-like n=1 Tax=Arachis duranensis TaxID=130453 RepID=A0A9C6TRM6_ARADU|nr:serine/threonine-protein kinase TOUSLED-like [Arachis duranensis]
MSDDMLVHFSSNSSNQSDQSLPTKIAKLEARMVGKASSTAAQQPGWSSVPSTRKFGGVAEDLAEACSSSDSDDDNGEEFLIQANTQKWLKLQEDDNSNVFEHLEVMTDGRQTSSEPAEIKISNDVNRKKHGCGRGNSGSGREQKYLLQLL